MIATPHAIFGAAVTDGLRKRPLLAVCVGVLTHVLLDTIPHTDYAFGWIVLIDLLAATSICSLAHLNLWGAFGALLPDFLQFSEKMLGLSLTRPLHRWWHTTTAIAFWPGIITQILAVVMGLIIMMLLRLRQNKGHSCS